MTTQLSLTYLAVVVLSLEMALMGYGYQANPRAVANRVFALLMLALAMGAGSILLLVTATTFQGAAVSYQQPVALWFHTLAIFSATPLLGWLLLFLLAPAFRFKHHYLALSGFLWLFSVSLLVLDLFVSADLLFQLDQISGPGYISLATFLTGYFGPLFYGLNVKYTHILFPLLILSALFTGVILPERRPLAWRLLAILLLLFVVNGLVWWIAPETIGLVGSLSIALIATWAIVRYQILSPSPGELQKALETAVRQAQTRLEAVNQSLEQALQAEREQRELAETLQDIGTALTATLDYERLLDLILAQIQRVVPYDSTNITLLENGQIRLVRAHGYDAFAPISPEQLPGSPFSLESTATYRIMAATKQPLCLPDVQQFEGWLELAETLHVRSWIGVPLLIADEVAGFLCVDKTEPGFYGEYHKNRLAALAYQVALALQQAQLFAESRQQAQQLEVLNDLSGQIVGLVSVQELTNLVVERLWSDFHYANVAIFMVNPEDAQEMVLQSVAGAFAHLAEGHDIRQSISLGLMGQAVTSGQSVLENDTLNNPSFIQPPFTAYSELVVPIKANKTVIGVLNIDSSQPNAFSQTDVALLTTVADQLAVAIQKARLFEQTLQRAHELEVLSVVSASLRAAHTVQEMLPIILENTVKAIGAAVGVIYLIDPPHNQVVSRAVYPPEAYPLGLTHLLGQGITGRVAASGEMYVAQNLQQDPHLYRHDGEEVYLAKLQTGIALPLRAEQIILGVIHLGLPDERHFTTFEIQLLTSISDIAANALHRAGVMESLEERVAARTRELQLAYGRLQELDRLKSKFISDVTHELRTPVANLNLYLDLLKMGRPEKQQQYMHIIESQTARLTQIVETTMQAPDPDVVIEPGDFTAVRFAEVVMTAVKPYLARAKTTGVELTLSIVLDLPSVWGNAEQLARVVNALLANAVNYTKQGQITVSLTADQPIHMTCLQITDTGMGIDEDEMPYIFDRFYRGRKVGQLTIPGVGLGLTLAKEIVERHDGRINMQSTPGTGTTCTILLPFIAQT